MAAQLPVEEHDRAVTEVVSSPLTGARAWVPSSQLPSRSPMNRPWGSPLASVYVPAASQLPTDEHESRSRVAEALNGAVCAFAIESASAGRLGVLAVPQE